MKFISTIATTVLAACTFAVAQNPPTFKGCRAPQFVDCLPTLTAEVRVCKEFSTPLAILASIALTDTPACLVYASPGCAGVPRILSDASSPDLNPRINASSVKCL